MTVQSARVLERVGQSEMRVGVNTASFGNVELHATLNQDQVGASIATSHLELHAAMMAEMPSLQRAMEQHHLRLDSLDLNARAGSEDSGGAGGHQPRSQPGTQSAYRFSGAGGPLPPPDSPAPPGGMAPHSWGLNVHA
jgi:flagellar hook-length control protein FliK